MRSRFGSRVSCVAIVFCVACGSDGSAGGGSGGASGSAGQNAGGSAGNPGTGGSNAGGSNTGGANTGGANAGGANTGGTNAGGSSEGGANAGGASAGGSSDTGGSSDMDGGTGDADTGGSGGANEPALTVTAVDTYVSDSAMTTQAVDLSKLDLAVLVYDAAGKTFSNHTPTTTAAGKFTVQTLPAGDRYVRYTLLGAAPQYFVTTSAAFDLGITRAGRPAVVAAPAGTTIDFSVTNLEAWANGDTLEFFSLGGASVSFDAEAYPGAPNPSATALSDLLLDLSQESANLIRGDLGDKAYLSELALVPLGATDSYRSLSRVFAIPSFSTTGGATTKVTGAFTTPSQVSQDVDWKNAAFDAVVTAGNPAATIGSRTLEGSAQAHTELGNVGATPDVFHYDASDGTDLATTFKFGNPYAPAWSLFVTANTAFSRTYSWAGAPANSFRGIVENRVLANGAVTATPLVSCVRNAKIGGKDALVDETGVGTTPIVTFDAPSTGTPNGYTVNVYRLGSNGTKTTATFAGSIVTVSKTLAVPPGIMAVNNGYVFKITADVRGSADMNVTAQSFPFPGGVADVLSGIIRP